MSKYTDFYGVTSVGDYPINSYFEYAVTATGNPVGYNATTGLYSHPNGSFWLQTGNTLPSASNAATYPNATIINSAGSAGYVADYANPEGSNFGGPAYDSTNDVWYIFDATTTITEYTFNGTVFTATGNTYGPTTNTNNDGGYQPTTDTIVAIGATNISRVSRASGTEVNTIANPATVAPYGCVGENERVFVLEYSNRIVYELDATTLATITTYNVSANVPANASGIAYDSTNNQYYILQEGTAIHRFDNTFTFIDTPLPSDPQLTSNTRTLHFYSNGNVFTNRQSNGTIYEFGVGVSTSVIGDATATTGSAGNPNFIRIG